ncbi:hypothetical protein GSI_14168 [Ganoderma sinense ZZ0214-1]|uniref:Uncharacterized protein n=1 Tax=Ganoderma sinense ZZ0214-1 TaxID=1077348 RepID=A0A2G8RSD7_9APHY|nr:hypothetical protein GSI_14168 [Ganoderma sinense ZZ0214-1]
MLRIPSPAHIHINLHTAFRMYVRHWLGCPLCTCPPRLTSGPSSIIAFAFVFRFSLFHRAFCFPAARSIAFHIHTRSLVTPAFGSRPRGLSHLCPVQFALYNRSRLHHDPLVASGRKPRLCS